MGGMRSIREKARRTLHDHMSSPAVYITHGQDTNPKRVTVRDHTKFAEFSAPDGAPAGMAERLDTAPRIRFLFAEVGTPSPRGMVFLSPHEGYFINATREPYGVTVDAEVTRMNQSEITQNWKEEYALIIEGSV